MDIITGMAPPLARANPRKSRVSTPHSSLTPLALVRPWRRFLDLQTRSAHHHPSTPAHVWLTRAWALSLRPRTLSLPRSMHRGVGVTITRGVQLRVPARALRRELRAPSESVPGAKHAPHPGAIHRNHAAVERSDPCTEPVPDDRRAVLVADGEPVLDAQHGRGREQPRGIGPKKKTKKKSKKTRHDD